MELLNEDAGRYVLDRRVAEAARYGRVFAVVRLTLPESELPTAVPAMRGVLREADVLARWGNGELIVILPETDRDGATVAAERMRSAVPAVATAAGAAHWVGDTAADLLRRAAWVAAGFA